MEEAGVIIIGAGVIGLAIAREISGEDRDVIVLEKNHSFGQETSSRNSEVVHSGIYYPPKSLKAQACVNGSRLIYQTCQKYNIPFKKIGKLIVAIKAPELNVLEKLHSQGRDNGVEGLEIIDREQIKSIEPNISALYGLNSPLTGIIDSHKFMDYLFRGARDKGAIISFDSEVTGISKQEEGYKLRVRNQGQSVDLQTRIVINSAGLDSHMVAAMAGIDIDKAGYALHFCKGDYFRVSSKRNALLRGLIYPAPRPKAGGLGIHATLDLAGNLKLGPDDEYLKRNERNYEVNPAKRRIFYDSAREFLPFIEEADLSPDMAGIRPKLQGQGDDFRDFVIREESDKGLPGLINLIGIESPGLTASLAIAKYVKEIIEKH